MENEAKLIKAGVVSSAYAYIDVDHPVVAWAAYRGVLVSTNGDRNPSVNAVSMMFAGIVNAKNNIRLANELIIEKIRTEKYPECVSRLEGLYFFEKLDDAKKAIIWGGHFKATNLSEISFIAKKISKHDLNWISYAPRDSEDRYTCHKWIDNYWQGKPYPGVEPMWELIVEGRAVILNESIRKRALYVAKKEFPKAVCIFEISKAAGELGFDLGQIKAFISKSNSKWTLAFGLDMREANDPRLLNLLADCRRYINYDNIAVGGDVFFMPDFSEFECDFEV